MVKMARVCQNRDWFVIGVACKEESRLELVALHGMPQRNKIVCIAQKIKKEYADTTKKLYRPCPLKTSELPERGKCFPTFFP